MREHGVDVTLLTFCGVHEGYDVVVPEVRVMRDNGLFRKMRSRFVTQWVLRVFEYTLTVLKATRIARDRPIYLRDGEPFPHLVHIINWFARKRWGVSSTGGLFTTGEGISPAYKAMLRMTTVEWPRWYRIGDDRIKYSVQNPKVRSLMVPLLGDDVAVVPLGHRIEQKMDKQQARSELGITDSETVLLVLGASHSGKDSETVFKALTGKTGVRLIHAGPVKHSIGSDPRVLEERYKTGAVVIVRQIGNEEKKRLFGAADWVVLSYIPKFASTTSMLWEACAYETPVIASSGSELGELVRYWGLGYVFHTGSAEYLAYRIEQARNPAVKDSFRGNCRDFIRFYSEDRWFRGTADLLRLETR